MHLPVSFWSGTPRDPPQLKATFWGAGGGVKKWYKNDPFWGGLEITNLLVFLILSRKSIFGSQLHWVCVRGVRRRLIQLMQLSAIFAVLVFVATLLAPWYPLQGMQLGMLWQDTHTGMQPVA